VLITPYEDKYGLKYCCNMDIYDINHVFNYKKDCKLYMVVWKNKDDKYGHNLLILEAFVAVL